MKKKHTLLPIMLTITMGITATFTFSACKETDEIDTNTQEATLIMDKAVAKIDSVSEMMFSAIEANNATTQTVATAYAMPKMRSSVQPMSATTIPSDVYFGEVNPDETLVRQLYVNYPYNIANYMLQNTTKAHKRYNHKYKVGQTVYGVATKTINDTINGIFENPSIDRPTLAVSVQKETDGISFIADWDWRNDILEANAPQYNSVIMTNAKVDYDHNTKEIDKITMTWYCTEQNGDFMASVMDFENNEFYFLEGWRSGVWNGISSAESLPDVFNSGELTYDKICEYPYTGIRAIKSNITSDINELQFTALNKGDRDLNGTGSAVEDTNGAEAEFAQLYNEIYEKVRGLKMRNESDYMSLSGATEVNFMEDAASYGLNRTKCVTYGNGIEFLFIDYEDLQSVLSELAKDNVIQSKQEFLSLVNGAKGCLDGLKHSYIGELGEYNGKTYTLEYVLDGDKEVDTWRIWSDKFAYKLGDGETFITFELENGKPVNIISEKVEGLTFNLIDGGKAYEVSYDRKSQTAEIVIPETFGGLPVTKIADNAFNGAMSLQSITIPASIRSTGDRSFQMCNGLQKVNFLGTVNQWAEIDFNIAMGMPTQFAGDLYVGGELLTTANITAAKISDWAFAGCKSLTSVTIGDSVQSIGANAFANCSSLGTEYGNAYYIGTTTNPYKVLVRAKSTDITSVQLHADTEIIGGMAFNNCMNLQNVQLNEKLTVIGYGAFGNCQAIRELYIPASVTEMSAIMFGEMRPNWVSLIQFRFVVQDGWRAIGGQIDGAEMTIDDMIKFWQIGELLESKFIRNITQ